MSWKLFQGLAASPGFGTEITVASQLWPILVSNAGCVAFLKSCNTIGAAVLQNISGGILSEL